MQSLNKSKLHHSCCVTDGKNDLAIAELPPIDPGPMSGARRDTSVTRATDYESKKEDSGDENKSKSTEGEGVAKVTEIINLENGKEDSEKKPDLDSTKEVQKNGDGGSKDNDEIMIIGIITQKARSMFNLHLKEYMF